LLPRIRDISRRTGTYIRRYSHSVVEFCCRFEGSDHFVISDIGLPKSCSHFVDVLCKEFVPLCTRHLSTLFFSQITVLQIFKFTLISIVCFKKCNASYHILCFPYKTEVSTALLEHYPILLNTFVLSFMTFCCCGAGLSGVLDHLSDSEAGASQRGYIRVEELGP
jgi:hypothetical protein